MGIRSTVAVGVGVVLLAGAAATDAAARAACDGEPSMPRRLSCYVDAAKAAGDPSVCLEAEETPVVYNCVSLYAEDTGDAGACATIPDDIDPDAGTLRDSCMAGVAVRSGDVSACGGLASPHMRDSCHLMVVTEGAADPAACDRIENETLRRACRE